MVKLDIISDPVCPWCYIGKAYLDRALEKAGDHPFVIEWHPFMLNPDMPPEGMDRGEYLEKKFGDRQRIAQMLLSLQDHAKTAGVVMNLEGQTHQPNTMDAHRLIHWAGLEQKQTPMVNAIFKAHWVDARRIDDHDVLVELAESIGMDGDVTRRLLAGDNDKDLIAERYAHSGKMGVNSVPTFVIANQHAVPGAQPVELWDNVIADIREQIAKA